MTHSEKCPVCQGNGYISSYQSIPSSHIDPTSGSWYQQTQQPFIMTTSPCNACRGLGYVFVPEIPEEDKKEKMSKEDLLVSILVDLNTLNDMEDSSLFKTDRILTALHILEKLNIEYHEKGD